MPALRARLFSARKPEGRGVVGCNRRNEIFWTYSAKSMATSLSVQRAIGGDMKCADPPTRGNIPSLQMGQYEGCRVAGRDAGPGNHNLPRPQLWAPPNENKRTVSTL